MAAVVVAVVVLVVVVSTMTKYPGCLLLLYRLLLLLVKVDASTLVVELVDHLVVVGSHRPIPVLKLELVEVLECLEW